MNFSTMQEWVDGFSGLPNYTKESIEAWYKLQPKAVQYPDTVSAIRLGFDGGLIDDAIKSLIKEHDEDKLRHAKEVLVREMSQTFSLGTADTSVLDMNEAILPPLNAKDIQGELPVGTKVICNKTGNKGTILQRLTWNQYMVDFDGTHMQVTGDDFKIAPKEDEGEKEPTSAEDIKKVESEEAKVNNFSANCDNKLNDLANYIATLNKEKAADIRQAILNLTSAYRPVSRHFIEMTIMKRYGIPMSSEGQPLSELLVKEIKAIPVPVSSSNFALTHDEKLKVIREVLENEGIKNQEELVSDLANIYFGLDNDDSASKAVVDTFKFYKVDVTEEAIKDIFTKISDKYQDLDNQNFSRKECMEELSAIFKKHNLGLGINEVKQVYDFLLENNLDLDKTAEVLAGIKTNSNTPLSIDAAKEVLKHFIQSVKEKHLSDGFVNFSVEDQKNFNKLVEDATELADLAVQAGLDDKFIFDNYDHLNKTISECKNSGEFLLKMTAELMDKKQFKKLDEAALAAQDFYEVIADSNWKKKHIKARNFSENAIERLYDAGYTIREIAIKLHEPVAKVQSICSTINNFSFAPAGKVWELLSRGAEFGAKKLLGPDRAMRLAGHSASSTTFLGKFLVNRDFWTGISNLTTLMMGLGFAADFIFACWDKLVNALHKKTEEERYEEVMRIIESDKRYKNRAGRLAKAFLTKSHQEKIDKLIQESDKQMVKAKSFSRKVVLVKEDK